MTRCGIRTCTLPEHRVTPLPSNAYYPKSLGRVAQTDDRVKGPNRPSDYRTDPGYDQPGPPRRSDFSLVVIVQAFVVFVAIVMFCFLASLVEVGS